MGLLIWLHSEELSYPNLVEYFLPEVTIQNETGKSSRTGGNYFLIQTVEHGNAT